MAIWDDREKSHKLSASAAELKEEIGMCEKKKELCEGNARKKVERDKLYPIVIQILVFLALAVLVFKLGWDTMEQWTWLATGIIFSIQFVIAIIIYRKSSLADVFSDKLKKEIERQYTLNDYSESKHNRLKEDLQRVLQQQRNL